MAKIVAVMSGKGGVGKTSITTLFATALSENKSVLVIDFDLAGPNIGRTLNVNGKVIKTENGLKPIEITKNLFVLTMASLIKPTDSIIWRGPKKINAMQMFFDSIENFDYVVIDTPPGISEEHLFLIDKDIICIIVSTPQNVALDDASSTVEFCKKNKIKVMGVIENMSGFICESCNCNTNIFGSKGAEMMAKHYNLKFLCAINLDKRLAGAIDSGNIFIDKEYLEAYQSIKKIVKNFIDLY